MNIEDTTGQVLSKVTPKKQLQSKTVRYIFIKVGIKMIISKLFFVNAPVETDQEVLPETDWKL